MRIPINPQPTWAWPSALFAAIAAFASTIWPPPLASSKQFTQDVEHGKPTVQFGRVRKENYRRKTQGFFALRTHTVVLLAARISPSNSGHDWPDGSGLETSVTSGEVLFTPKVNARLSGFFCSR